MISRNTHFSNNAPPRLQHHILCLFIRRIIFARIIFFASTTFLGRWLHHSNSHKTENHHHGITLASAFNNVHNRKGHRTRTNLYSQKKINTQHRQEKDEFSHEFREEFQNLLKLRRDVRRFDKDRHVPEDILNDALHVAFNTAPSVGLSEPWRIVRVENRTVRDKVLQNFMRCNQFALEGYYNYTNKTMKNNVSTKTKAELYASLKLSGMKEAPIQLAIFCDEETSKGSGLGVQSMPEMKRYSVVCAIQSFWLLARSVGLGVGWVSILDPKQLLVDLGLDDDIDISNNRSDYYGSTATTTNTSSWTLVGYLCVGYPDMKEMDGSRPELERFGWEQRRGGTKQQVDDGNKGNMDDSGDDFDLDRQLPIIVV